MCGSPAVEPEHTPEEKRGTKVRIIAAVIVVAVLVVAFTIHYIESHQFHGGIDPPYSVLSSSIVTDGVKLTFAAPTKDTQWNLISIMLDDGENGIWWSLETTNLDSGISSTAEYGSKSLGLLTVYCNATDIAGNGYVNNGDFFTLTTGSVPFSSVTTYTTTVVYAPAATMMCNITFSG